jgi:hypothetical protein
MIVTDTGVTARDYSRSRRYSSRGGRGAAPATDG